MSKGDFIGFTKDYGYQVGVSRTVNLPVEDVWKFLLSKKGMSVWLGTWAFDKWETGIEYLTEEGTQGMIRVFKIFSHIRLSWRRKDWAHDSILQIRTIPNAGKTTLSIHQEKLLDAKQRDEMKHYWTHVLEDIVKQLQDK